MSFREISVSVPAALEEKNYLTVSCDGDGETQETLRFRGFDRFQQVEDFALSEDGSCPFDLFVRCGERFQPLEYRFLVTTAEHKDIICSAMGYFDRRATVLSARLSAPRLWEMHSDDGSVSCGLATCLEELQEQLNYQRVFDFIGPDRALYPDTGIILYRGRTLKYALCTDGAHFGYRLTLKSREAAQ